MTIGGSFGKDKDKKKTSSRNVSNYEKSGTQTQRTIIEREGLVKLIEEALSQAGGLASIFQGEQTTGLYNSTVSSQEAGDLTTKIAGELAKLTAETVTTRSERGADESRGGSKSSGTNTNIGLWGSTKS